ncbi:MAG TPA: hypothetical protein VKE71_08185 [Candidatus Angelobacter sp.]|nr:hypothetical protein [Candidatus Angelobacter sp.]
MIHLKYQRYFVIAVILFATVALVAQPTDSGTAGGRLVIVGVKGSDSVYLNGTGPEYLVGTVKDTKNNKLILPPGLQHVILIDPQGDKQVYSGYVQIKPNQKAVLHVDKSDTYYEKWTDAGGTPIMPIGKTALVPVSGTFSATNVVPCGGKARLVWSTNGVTTMVKHHSTVISGGLGVSGELFFDPAQQTTSIQGYNQVVYSGLPGSGELLVDPGEGDTYVLESFGPGGVFISAPQTVRVNKEVHTTLAASPAIMRYHRVGDKVLEDPSTTLTWTADNADSVTIDPIGPVKGTSGQEVVKYSPTKTDLGQIDETRVYKITATNPCGGSDSTTASVQVAGSIDPEIVAALEPLPTKLPKTGSPLPLIGLLGLGSLLSGLVLRMFRKG